MNEYKSVINIAKATPKVVLTKKNIFKIMEINFTKDRRTGTTHN